MDALQSCARKYAELCGYTYDCTIARKNARVSLTFSFSAYEFRHLAGLHRLKHPRLQTNSERLFKDILAGKITLVDLRKASNWEEESEKFLSRLNALAQLDVLMDEFLLIYGFSGEKLARQIPPIRTKIDADYLIKFELEEGITFFFSVKQKDTFCGRSTTAQDKQNLPCWKKQRPRYRPERRLCCTAEILIGNKGGHYAFYHVPFAGRRGRSGDLIGGRAAGLAAELAGAEL